MAIRKHNPGCPCCEDDCRIAIAGWNQVAGTWTIDGDNLETASSSALAVTTNEHPDELSTHYVSVKVKGDDDGDILRVVVAYADADNYLYAELEVGTADGILRLFQVTGGSAFQLGVDVTVTGAKSGELHTVRVCYDGEYLIVNVVGKEVYMQAVTATGTYVGLATGAIDTLTTFEDFEWHIHYDAPNNCPQCLQNVPCSRCEEGVWPARIKVVLSGIITPLGSTCTCGDLDGTWICYRQVPSCWSNSNFISNVCGALYNNFVSVRMSTDDILTVGVHETSGATSLMKFNKNVGNKPECLEFTDEELTEDADNWLLEWCGSDSTSRAWVTTL